MGGNWTEQQIKTYVQLAILAWILWDLYTTPKALRMALEAYILGAYVTIASTILNYLAGQQVSASEVRYAGIHVNANDLALILALGLPIAWHLAVSAAKAEKTGLFTLLNYAYVPAALFAIILTATRTAFFAAAPAILYMVGTANRLKLFHRVLILAALVGIFPFTPQSSIERLATIGSSLSTGDLGGRGRLWQASIAAFSKHPFLGVGSGALQTPTLLPGVAHNTFLSVSAELGLIGLSFFVIMLAIVVYQAANQPKSLSWLWLTVLTIWFIGAFTLTWEYRKVTWLLLSLIVISANLFRRGDRIEEGSSLFDEPLVLPRASGIQAKG
jgi:O-antigen ligase